MRSVCPETRNLLIGFFRAIDIMIHVPFLCLARHSPIEALAEKRDRCKAKRYAAAALSAHAKANVADSFAAEPLFRFSLDFSLANFLSL